MATTDSITDRLRRDILDGVYPPGDRLIELQLSEQYRVGRAAVRAAIVELTSEGLVEREANRGATVRRITVEEAVQVTEARAALEGLIAAHAARNATDDERDELREIEQLMRTAVAGHDNLGYSDLNARFHRRLREMSGHTIASHLVANLRDRATHHQYRLALMPGRPAESLEQHARIIAAVVEGDPIEAEAAMKDHLTSVVEVLYQWADAGALA